MNSEIKTPQTHPDHSVVGHHFGGQSWGKEGVQIYFCDSYDPAIGFWMTNIADNKDRRNVSERAIGRAFYEALDEGDSWWITTWNVRVPKVAK